MSDKPSLYVVEKKEVVILVVLFVLVTVLSFTLGVRYGESVGKKMAAEQSHAAKELGEANESGGSGTLGKQGESHEGGGADDQAASEHEPAADHKEAPKDAKAEHVVPHAEEKAKGDAHAEKHESPEALAKGASKAAGQGEALDKNSDEYLLNALKDAGVEPPGGKSPKGAKLPDEVKEASARAKIPAGSYVIQVGSHPTRAEAETQVRQLKARHVSAEILPAFKDKQGEWHRVVVGSFKNKRDADKEAASLKSKGSVVSYFVWRLP